MTHMTALSTELRLAIEAWSSDLLRDGLLLQLAKQGKLPPRAFGLYLESLRYLFQHSHQNLVAAAGAAQRIGHVELAAYLECKAHEERGHDQWATNDLSRLPTAAAHDLRPARAIEDLVALQRALIEQHPVYMLVYALWAEYFTVLLGDEWLDALSASGYGRGQVSSIAKHLDADREHAASGLAAVDTLWCGQPERALLLGVVERAGRIFARFCDEICVEAERAA
jgi:hypothetical protein